jgi:hypothetical protein
VVADAVVSALSVESRYGVEDVIKVVKSVGGSLDGQTAELVSLFSDKDELEAVKAGQDWVKTNGSWIEGFGELGSLEFTSRR